MLIIGRAAVGRPSFVLPVSITNYSSYKYNSIGETSSPSTKPPGRPLQKFINLSGVSLNKSPVVTKPFKLHKYDRDVNQIKSLQEAESFYQNLKTRKSTYTYDTRSESTVRKTDTGHSSSTRRSPPDHEDSYKDRNDFFVKKKPYNSSNQSANQTLHTNENGTSSADLLSKKSGTRGINYSDRNFTYSDKKSRFFDPKKKNDFDKLPQDFEKDSRNIVRKNPEYSGEPPRYSDSKVKLFFDRNSRYSDDNSAEPNRRRRQSQYPKENRVASDEKNLPYEMKELPHVENQPPIDRIDIECTFHVNPEHPVASSVAVKLLRDNLKDHFGIENLSHMHLMILKEIKAGNHCFVKCPTGTGKSLMGLVGILETLHFSKNFKVLLIVPTVQLLLQYQNWVYALHPAIASRSQFLPMSEEPNSKGKGPEPRFEDSVFFWLYA